MKVNDKMRKTIDNTLQKIGFRKKLHGSIYLATAVEVAIQNPEMNLCRGVYVEVGKIFNKPYFSIERDIRFAVNDDKEKNYAVLNDLLGDKVFEENKKMTASKLVKLLSAYIVKKYKSKTKIVLNGK